MAYQPENKSQKYEILHYHSFRPFRMLKHPLLSSWEAKIKKRMSFDSISPNSSQVTLCLELFFHKYFKISFRISLQIWVKLIICIFVLYKIEWGCSKTSIFQLKKKAQQGQKHVKEPLKFDRYWVIWTKM